MFADARSMHHVQRVEEGPPRRYDGGAFCVSQRNAKAVEYWPGSGVIAAAVVEGVAVIAAEGAIVVGFGPVIRGIEHAVVAFG